MMRIPWIAGMAEFAALMASLPPPMERGQPRAYQHGPRKRRCGPRCRKHK